MNVQDGVFISGLQFCKIDTSEKPMSTGKIKDALITTGVVLITLYVLNMTPAKPFIQKAIQG